MNSRRNTPQGKIQSRPSSTSQCRTPILNSTILEGRNITSRPVRSASACNLTLQMPSSTASLVDATPFIDYEVECDIAYSDYLQVLMKKEIMEKVMREHEDDMNGQIIIKKENLHKSKLALEKIRWEIAELEKLDDISELINVLSDNFAQFSALSNNFDLEEKLLSLVALLNAFANRVNVENVKKLEKQEDFDKLDLVVKQCVTVFEKMNLNEKNVNEVNQLASILKKYQHNLEQVAQKQEFIGSAQKNQVYQLFKSISDVYAEKEKNTFFPKFEG